ncbi:MAG: hypothetical protein N4A57_12800 [Anaeromicrobium sp.]|jgi:hypothetical protein|uniref:hypothetical protein n=1 Tax=Anaeromicrobium sp. TaxID=1929132 RepID=UPI0025D708F6|nr:hypothetical protein [Anaeromicrobium sp.]MCT4595129.1 hypothetical protein [Anaeromicrobium sp.]
MSKNKCEPLRDKKAWWFFVYAYLSRKSIVQLKGKNWYNHKGIFNLNGRLATVK